MKLELNGHQFGESELLIELGIVRLGTQASVIIYRKRVFLFCLITGVQVVVTAPHRKEAFEACEHLISIIKVEPDIRKN